MTASAGIARPDVEVSRKLGAIRRRLSWLTIQDRVSWCLLPGLLIALALLVAHKLDRVGAPYHLAAAAIALSLACGLTWGALQRISLLDVALLADRKLGLKERLSNAVVFAQRYDDSPLVPAILADAARHARDVTPSFVLPYHVSRPARWSLFAAILLVAAGLAPVVPLGRSPGEVAVRQEMREQGRRLTKVAQRMRQQAAANTLYKAEELARKLQNLARDLEKAKLSKREALLRSGKLAAELREAQRLAALQAGAEAISRFAESLGDVSFDTAALQAIARSVREQRADEMAARLSKLAFDVRKGKYGSAGEQQKLAEDLQRLAEAAKASGMGEMAQALREAAGAVTEGRAAEGAQAIERAAQAANKAAEAAAENESLKQMSEELRKSQQDLAKADQPQCEVHGSACPNPKPGGG